VWGSSAPRDRIDHFNPACGSVKRALLQPRFIVSRVQPSSAGQIAGQAQKLLRGKNR